MSGMRFDILTIFPELVSPFFDGSLLGAARRQGLLDHRHAELRETRRDLSQKLRRPAAVGVDHQLGPGSRRAHRLQAQQRFVGVELERPLALDGQLLEGPVPMIAEVREGPLHDAHAPFEGDVHGSIRAQAVDDEDLLDDVLQIVQRAGEVLLFVERQQDGGHR